MTNYEEKEEYLREKLEEKYFRDKKEYLREKLEEEYFRDKLKEEELKQEELKHVKMVQDLHDQMVELCERHKELCMERYGTPDLPEEELKKIREHLANEYREEQAMFFGQYADEEVFIKENEMEI